MTCEHDEDVVLAAVTHQPSTMRRSTSSKSAEVTNDRDHPRPIEQSKCERLVGHKRNHSLPGIRIMSSESLCKVYREIYRKLRSWDCGYESGEKSKSCSRHVDTAMNEFVLTRAVQICPQMPRIFPTATFETDRAPKGVVEKWLVLNILRVDLIYYAHTAKVKAYYVHNI